MWLLMACLGYVLLAIVALFDKIIVSREKVNPFQFTFFSTILLAPVLLALPYIARPTAPWVWVSVALAGVSYAIALYAMYRSFELGEVSHNGPLIGAITPLCTLVLTSLVLPEPFSQQQYIAIALLVVGSLVISFKKTVTSRHWHKSILYSMWAGWWFAVFFVAAKYTYQALGFGAGLLWIFGSMGAVGILLLAAPTVRGFIRRGRSKTGAAKIPFVLMTLDKAAAGGGVIVIQYALANGSPTIINALTGLQYAILVVLVAIITRVWPHLYSEMYERGELAEEIIAVLLIGGGLVLLV